jgi:dihydroorotate dehydrogenase electron transfer subunit
MLSKHHEGVKNRVVRRCSLTASAALSILVGTETPMPHDITTPVTENRDLGNGNFLLEFESPEIAAGMGPAQFLMIGIPGSATLLRRPYSVCGLPGTFRDDRPHALQVLYKVIGQGTGLLASLKPGSPIQVLGPLGRGFEAPENPETLPVFVAGGIGSAPFPALASMLSRGPRPHMFYGARGAGDLALLDWFQEHTGACDITTDDGTAGHHGRVTDLLVPFLDDNDPASLHIYACGPDPMLHAVAAIATERGVTCDLSLEAHMACGFGVCLGCVVPTHVGDGATDYERICVEGPVMRAERLAW